MKSAMHTGLKKYTGVYKSVALLLVGLYIIFGSVYMYVRAQAPPTPIRTTNDANPSALDLIPNFNWTKGNVTGYNDTEIIASRLELSNNTTVSNQPFFFDLTFDHSKNALGILRLETTGISTTAPITTNVNTTNPFLSDRDGLDNDGNGAIDNPGEAPLPTSAGRPAAKARFIPTTFGSRIFDDIAGAPNLTTAGVKTQTYNLLNRPGQVVVTFRGPFASDQLNISKIPTNFNPTTRMGPLPR
ncbi:MAG: hypothetical protein HYR55_19190 [Acidobacteria bacterium]|nr:hypothetical protein [Acidobacteriota bacterium]MBI3655393.1 hypothetical protein [Acidobacteriota bacterium]